MTFEDFATSQGYKVELDTVSFSTEAEATDFADKARGQGFGVYIDKVTTVNKDAWHVTHTGP